MDIRSYLSGYHHQIPIWLQDYSKGARFFLANFFNSRVLYYPGAGSDDQPIALFGASHSVHCFLYVDYGIKRSEIGQELLERDQFLSGYNELDRISIENRRLMPKGLVQHINPADTNQSNFIRGFVRPYCVLVLLERSDLLDDEYGPQRLAIMFLGTDGIASYDAIFCQETYRPPFAIVIQDHGFGGNYDSFGHGGLLENLALKFGAIPEYLLVGDDSQPWDGFAMLGDVSPSRGGMHHQWRSLFQRANT